MPANELPRNNIRLVIPQMLELQSIDDNGCLRHYQYSLLQSCLDSLIFQDDSYPISPTIALS